MTINLQTIIHSMFRSKYDRRNNGEFRPYFYRFIGVEDTENYDNLLKTIEVKCDEISDRKLIFDNGIPLNGEMELIEYIYNELSSMNIYNMANEDIIIFNDSQVNNIFLKAMDYVIPLSIKNENFFSDNVRNNFITKLIVWAYSYLREINFNDDINPKCIFYGNIERHEVYFLMILYLMNFDVIYINPLKEEYFEGIDTDKLSTEIKKMNILDVKSFSERTSMGRVIENNETLTKKLQRDVREELFTNTGMYVPWQFRGKSTKSILLNGIDEDIFIYWNEPAKLREGFKTSTETVKVPCFFQKFDGEYLDKDKYYKLVKHCTDSTNTLFFNNGDISEEVEVTDDMFQLMFCQLSDGTFDIEEIKKLPIYKFSKYSIEVQDLLLNKFNEVLLDKTLFVEPLDKNTILKLLVLVISLNKNIVRLIDNFDFTSNIPKIVIYLNGEDEINDDMTRLLAYLHIIGIDIVIFNPSGLYNICKIIRKDRVNIIRLEEMNYKSKYKKLEPVNNSIFSRLFK
ncbi:YceG family protein [Clostridium sardiniense]|uniref:YceG family protein n=1 Tax=Clostridium sardiniense TaxID=29369 RepID=UPI003D32AB94